MTYVVAMLMACTPYTVGEPTDTEGACESESTGEPESVPALALTPRGWCCDCTGPGYVCWPADETDCEQSWCARDKSFAGVPDACLAECL